MLIDWRRGGRSTVVDHDLGFRYKKCILAVLFLLSEIISFVLDKIGGSNWVFLLASFLLSAIGFLTTIYTSLFSRTVAAVTRSESEKQLIAVEIVFSFIQLVVTYIQLIRMVFGAKSSNNESLLPLAFAVISVVFTFRNTEVVSDSASVGQITSSTATPAVDESKLQRVSSMLSQSTTSTQLVNQLHDIEPTVVDETEIVERMPKTTRPETTVSFGDDDDDLDAKADDFINKFRKQLRLQRLDSLLRYKEMISKGK